MTFGGSIPRLARAAVAKARPLACHSAQKPAPSVHGLAVQSSGCPRWKDSRKTQAEGVEWFVQVAKRVAPEFELYELPRYSSIPLVIRRRSADARTPFDGLWSPLLIRASVCEDRRSSLVNGQNLTPLKASPGRRHSTVYFVNNRSSSRTFPDAPCVVMSPLSNSCFVFSRAGRKWKLCAKPGGANEIDLRTSSETLGTWLHSVYSAENRLSHKMGRLEDLFVNSTTSTALRKHRTLLVQLLQLPIPRKLSCRREIDSATASDAWNARFGDRRSFVRGPMKRTDCRRQKGLRRLYYSIMRTGGAELPRNSCGVDYLIIMLDTNENPLALGGIGMIPLATTGPEFLLRKSQAGEPVLKQQVIAVIDQNNHIVGGDFKDHASEFFFFFSKDVVSNRNVLETELASFFNRIFTKWDNCTVSKAHEDKDEKFSFYK